MERTSNDDWQAVARRLRQKSRQTSGGVLMEYRRRKQERAIRAAAIGLALMLFAWIAIFASVGRATAKRQSTLVPAAAQPVETASVSLAIPTELDNPVHILLLGSDQRGEDRSYRTDVIVLVSIDPVNFTASAVSFPRDLWVEPPTLYPMKINMIQAIGGFEAMADMFASNFGIRPDFYVLTNFSGFTHLIDSLGGIDVHIGQPISDSCDLPQEPSGICTLDEGVLPMDGQTALWYARSRGSSSDYDRLRRAQEVVQAVFERMMHLDALAHLPEYYADLSEDVETNLTLGDLPPLLPAAVRLFQEPERIRRFVINEDHATPSWSWDGMWILLPDHGAIRALLEEAGYQLP